MRLNLVDELVLLALDDDKGEFVSNPITFGYGLAGALIFQLYVNGSIEISNKKVTVKNADTTGDNILNYGLEKLLSHPPYFLG